MLVVIKSTILPTNVNDLSKITKTVDINSILCFFFNELYDKYGEYINQDIIFDMKTNEIKSNEIAMRYIKNRDEK